MSEPGGFRKTLFRTQLSRYANEHTTKQPDKHNANKYTKNEAMSVRKSESYSLSGAS